MNVLIVGGLGYIGSALVETYRQDVAAGHVHLTVIDREFRPHLIERLPEGARFVQCDIGNLDCIAPITVGQDVVFLLAGKVEAEKSINAAQEYWQENYEKPVRFIECVDPDARLIFTSTANVYSGNSREPGYLFTEQEPAQPKYPYSEAKVAVEKYLQADACRDYVITRLATNYGWSSGFRFNLVCNLFVKLALQGGPLKLHGGGDNYRPFVCVQDVAQSLRFLAVREDARQGIFHVVYDSYRIRDIAEAAANLVEFPIEIQHVARRADFGSYSIDGSKLRSMGFGYQWPLPRALLDVAARLGAARV